jgi:hypothetical protein
MSRLPLALLLVSGVAQAESATMSTVQLTGFPFIQQKPDFCGEADVAMAMGQLGHAVTQDQVFALGGVDPAKGRGVHADELATALRALGVEPGRVWFHIDPKHAKSEVDSQWQALYDDLKAGQPSIVCMHYADEPHTTEHFRLITGYDANTDEVVYQEPAEENGANRRMKRELFEKLWVFKPNSSRWMVIRLQMPAPKQPPSLTQESTPTLADVVQRVMTLKEKLPDSFTVVWEKPFLVIGDETPAKVRERSTTLVRHTRDLLLKDFFTTSPSHIQEVWILKDKASYERYSKEWFNTIPDTPYGYYLNEQRALVMNIKPGYGTLTHELVHPFMEEAWKDAPPWLNEGLASLFEQPAEEKGHMVGHVNWRLPGLLDDFKHNEVLSFQKLAHLSNDEFYSDGPGDHYAQARYLCYWLQEKGLLIKLVRRAQELKDKDPTGWDALREVLGDDPEAAFKEWEKFVKGLSYPSRHTPRS